MGMFCKCIFCFASVIFRKVFIFSQDSANIVSAQFIQNMKICPYSLIIPSIECM